MNSTKTVPAEVERAIAAVVSRVKTLKPGDMMGLGQLLKGFNALKALAEKSGQRGLMELASGLYGYTGRLALMEETDHDPLIRGVEILQNLFFSGATRRPLTLNDPLMTKLGLGSEAADQETGPIEQSEKLEMTQENVDFIKDFVVEAFENLERIEVSMVELENSPDDREIVNAVFRSFHTIKGISRCLHLTKINSLSHATEDLLDAVRKRQVELNEANVDLILKSVDLLKQLINGIEERLTAERYDELEVAVNAEELVSSIKAVLSHGLTMRPLSDEFDPGPTAEMEAATRRKGQRLQDLHVKVDTRKLDNLIDLTGELVIAQAMVRQNESLKGLGDPMLHTNLNHLTQIVSGLQKTAMGMRMVPIRHTFQKMVRVVRDLARNAGKRVDLRMTGEETEIDRNVVDELYEPLVHMVRNAVDHGLETPDAREALGKDGQGCLDLRAYHKGGNIVIEIQDDGRGIDRDRVLEKARANGLVDPDESLEDREIFDLIFHPGFSTSQKVTDVSGRGVGMDVVKRGIEKLRGRVDIDSAKGRGTVFIITLPLTLAIIEGMVVRVGDERYIIPTMAIQRTFRPTRDDYHTVKGKGEMIRTREAMIPMVRLHRLFDVPCDSMNPWEGLVVQVEHKSRRACLLLDELIGKEEIVIKSLGETLRHVMGLAGGAILGDGRIALILDMESLFQLSASSE